MSCNRTQFKKALSFTFTALTREHATERTELLSQMSAERERVKEMEGILGQASSDMEGCAHTSNTERWYPV